MHTPSRLMVRLAAFFLALALAAVAFAQRVEVQEHFLDNGLKLLLVPRGDDPNVACGWVAKVGSVNERPGITGVAHLFEHMMFKGTHAIGTTDIAKDLQIIERLDALRAQIQTEEEALIEKHRRGLIDDPKDPTNRNEKHQQLLKEFNDFLAQQKELIVKDDFSRIYTTAGGSSLNAFTMNDLTAYFINVPSNKLELFYWMESDRLANPVFREFYSERDVVHEERRMRVDSTPTGKLQEQFDAMFWQSSPYSWPVIGWPSDLEGITRDEALAFFSTYYAPNNLTIVLVGRFDPKQAIELAERYFGRLERGPEEPEPVRTREVEQLAEKRFIGYAETRPTVEVRYHTVADAHKDEPPLLMLSNILNGRTGRLYKSLVLEQKIATGAQAGVNGLKYDGYFSLMGIVRPGKDPKDLEEALYQELEVLKNEPVGEHEMQKVKNEELASDFRRLRSNFGLMVQLMQYDALGTWENINRFSDRIQAVTPEDIQRVATKYFTQENRNVAYFLPKQQQDQAPSARSGENQ